MSKKREMRVINRDESNFDKILAYYINPEEFPLSETLDDMRKRWVEIFTMRVNGFTKTMIVKIWEKEKGLSQAQAYVDIRNSLSLFGNIDKTEKLGFQSIWLQWAENYMLRMRQKGNDKMEGFMLKLLRPDDKDDQLEFNPEKLENVELQLNVPKEVIDLIKNMTKAGVQDFNNFNAVDVEYTDVPDDTEQ
ncbi:hypothetical protein [Flavobacterium sp. 3HN19-14]|uniref:hypothetical protein n=1 Tax=Flavobacterium sp. 3HN19-14 TaxID=3448133 RepID=UPI003EDFD4E2